MVSGSAFKFALLTAANFDEILVPPAARKRPQKFVLGQLLGYSAIFRVGKFSFGAKANSVPKRFIFIFLFSFGAKIVFWGQVF